MGKALNSLFKKDPLSAEDNLSFWMAIGPLCLLVTVFVCMIQGEMSSLVLGLASVFILPFSWKFRRVGVFLNLGLLVASYVVILSTLPHEKMWLLGTGISLVLGSIVTHLSFQEGRRVLDEMLTSKQEALELCDKHRSSLNDLEKERLKEKQNYEENLLQFEVRHQELVNQLEAQEKVAFVLEKEYRDAFKEKADVLLELVSLELKVKDLESRLELSQNYEAGDIQHIIEKKESLERDIEHLQASSQEAIAQERMYAQSLEQKNHQLESDLEILHDESTQQITLLHQQKSLLEDQHNQLENEHKVTLVHLRDLEDNLKRLSDENAHLHAQQIALIENEKATLRQDYTTLLDQYRHLEEHQKIWNQEKASYDQRIVSLEEKLRTYEEERHVFADSQAVLWASQLEEAKMTQEELKKEIGDLKKYYGLYHQLREQFEEKSNLAHQLRQENFDQETAFLAHQKDYEQKVIDMHKRYEEQFLRETQPLLEQITCQEDEISVLKQTVSHLSVQLKEACNV